MNDDKMTNHSAYGVTLEYLICCKYNLQIHQNAFSKYMANYEKELDEEINAIIPSIFSAIGSEPIKLLAYTREYINDVLTYSPYDFLLENGKTVTIKTNERGSKIAPRIVGQAGYRVLNSVFGYLCEKQITSQEDIKLLFYNKIASILPIMLNYMFESDYLVHIEISKNNEISIIKKSQIKNIIFDKNELTYTKNISEWNESNTLKYKGISIAEVQTHYARTFKFRFNLKNIMQFIQ